MIELEQQAGVNQELIGHVERGNRLLENNSVSV